MFLSPRGALWERVCLSRFHRRAAKIALRWSGLSTLSKRPTFPLSQSSASVGCELPGAGVPNPNCAKRQRACRRQASSLSTDLFLGPQP
jgi:hypothetical protein